ncbi:unnamed protein product [Soboliphyme baturini]|uniref:SEFIR domain-containing protein n=1 Tax=Soboliphyme baturini TaxID=241478 RepID=A0A183IWU7_9BILA|nr:unnamed protein product [Soboliphyme baturini]
MVCAIVCLSTIMKPTACLLERRRCRSSCRSHYGQPLNCAFYDTTLACQQRSDELLAEFDNVSVSGLSPSLSQSGHFNDVPCPSSMVAVTVVAYMPNDVHSMFTRIKVLITVSEPRMRAVVLHWSCVEGSASDTFCQNLSRPYWPRFYWPCRMVEWRLPLEGDSEHGVPLDSQAQTSKRHDAAIKIEIDCFTLPVMSTIQLTVSFHPLQCQSRYLMKGPSARRLFGAVLANDWIPFIVLDANDGRGAAVNLSAPPDRLNIDRMLVEIWNVNAGILEVSKTVFLPETHLYIDGMRTGGHFLDVHVIHSSCPQSDCLTQRLAFNFTSVLQGAAKDDGHRRRFTLLDLALLLLMIGVLLVVVFLVVVVRRRLRPKVPTAVTFATRPKVFLIYSDDSHQHSEVVLQLANFLSSNAHCDVMFDRWSTKEDEPFDPYAWIAQCFSRADFFLVVMSEGSKLFFQYPRRFRLVSVAPWVDTFEPSMTLLLPHLLKDDVTIGSATAADRFSDRVVCVRFSYSTDDCILPFWRMLSCSKFSLLSELPALVCYLHRFSSCSVDVTSVTEGADALPAAVDDCCCAIASGQPAIDEARLQPLSPSTHVDRSMDIILHLLVNVRDELELQSTNAITTEDLYDLYLRQTSKCERYKLLPPSQPLRHSASSGTIMAETEIEVDTEAGAGRYALLPADVDC